jgi:hypothetical protein
LRGLADAPHRVAPRALSGNRKSDLNDPTYSKFALKTCVSPEETGDEMAQGGCRGRAPKHPFDADIKQSAMAKIIAAAATLVPIRDTGFESGDQIIRKAADSGAGMNFIRISGG